MTSLFRSTPCGDTIFCDDIRTEFTGKSILIGVYAGYMIVAATFPTKVNVALRVIYQEHHGESTDPLELVVYAPGNKDDEPFFRAPLSADFRKTPRPNFETAFDEEDTSEEADHVLTTMINLQLNEIPVSKPGRIRVRMKRGDTMVRLGSLGVLPSSMASQIFGGQPAQEQK